MRLFSNLLALCAVASVALALPSRVAQLSSIPSNAAKLAHDMDRDVLIAYDRDDNLLGELPASAASLPKRDAAGICATISADDIQKLPGWGAIHDYAVDNWGKKWDTIDANPSEYSDRGAQVCISGDVSAVTLDTDPSCQTQSQATDGQIVGAEGTISLQATEGTTSQTTVTVTKESSIAAGASISAEIAIPALADVSTELTSEVTLTNTLDTANSFTSSNTQQQTITVNSKAGQTCSLNFDVQTCQATGHGQQRMVATGWVWFYYGKQRKGHYKTPGNPYTM